MSLRAKVLLFVMLISLSFIGASWLVQKVIMHPEFARLELREADADRQRVVEALHRDLEFLSRFANDYAAWDDTYNYLRNRNTKYEKANLVIETFENTKLDVMAYFLTDGTLVWGKARSAEGELVAAPDLISVLRRQLPTILPTMKANARQQGYLKTEQGILLLGAAPVTTTDLSGAILGSVILGRFLTDSVVAELAARTGISFGLHRVDTLSVAEREAMTHLSRAGAVWRDVSDPALLRSYTLLGDLEGQPALLLRSDLPRVVSAGARQAARWATLTSLAAGVLMSLAMWLVLTRMIVSPLTRVTRHAVQVGAEGQLHARLQLTGQDEIAVLGREFDRMVGRLEETQRKLVDVAHDAGRAEIAQDVLHNVGNVLNSAHVSAELASQTLARSEVPSLGQVVRLLEEHRDELGQFLERDERGRHLPAFLAELATELVTEHDTLGREMATVTNSLEHIREIVRAQNEHAGATPLLERMEPSLVMDQALALTADSFSRDHIQVERLVEAQGPLMLDRHRILQVLGNLLTNAMYAVSANGTSAPHIWITVDRVASPAGERLRFRVRDNGVGVPAENLDRIFVNGFSTRPGSRGRGLHSAANQAREMGGDLVVMSDGPGRGATFSLSIPAVPPKVPG